MKVTSQRPSIPFLTIAAIALMAFLYAPLLVAALYGFNSGDNITWPPAGFSLRWFAEIFGERLFRVAFQTSLVAALWTSLVSCIVGAMAAFAFTRRDTLLSRSIESLARLPVMLPPLFIGIGLIVLMRVTGVSPSMVTIVLGHTLVVIPFVVLVVTSRLRTYDPELELAARDLGASPVQALARVTLPLIAPAILGAALLAFAFSFDEVLITNFTSGTESTVPIYVLGRLRRLVDPGANAVAVILLLIPWLAFGIGSFLLRRTTGSGLGEALTRRIQ
jgi:spermidine/putrescine transport system permease protein